MSSTQEKPVDSICPFAELPKQFAAIAALQAAFDDTPENEAVRSIEWGTEFHCEATRLDWQQAKKVAEIWNENDVFQCKYIITGPHWSIDKYIFTIKVVNFKEEHCGWL